MCGSEESERQCESGYAEVHPWRLNIFRSMCLDPRQGATNRGFRVCLIHIKAVGDAAV